MSFLREIRQTREHLKKHHEKHDVDAPILNVEHVSVRYESGLALEDITFQLQTSQRLAVVGPNGAGKARCSK